MVLIKKLYLSEKQLRFFNSMNKNKLKSIFKIKFGAVLQTRKPHLKCIYIYIYIYNRFIINEHHMVASLRLTYHELYARKNSIYYNIQTRYVFFFSL